MTQGFKSIKEIMDDMVTAGNRNYARMSDKNESGMACGFCGRDLVEEVLSSDLDGNRREIVWYCPNKCDKEEMCGYDSTVPATGECWACHTPLCDTCGHRDPDGNKYCHFCWEGITTALSGEGKD